MREMAALSMEVVRKKQMSVRMTQVVKLRVQGLVWIGYVERSY